MQHILLNGNPHQTDSVTLAQLVKELHLSEKRIAIEVNGRLIPKSKHQDQQICENDIVEIVHAVGGG